MIDRVPGVGDAVWWAPKRLGCVVRKVDGDRIVTFQGGEIVRNNRGRETPRWTVQAKLRTVRWHSPSGMWVVGRGPMPTMKGGIVILPEPVSVSGYAQGSFATEKIK